MFDKQQELEVVWTEEMCDDILTVKESLDKLAENEDFKLFKKFYIEKQRVDLCRDLGTHSLAKGPNRQLAIESLIAIDNFEYFIDTWLPNRAESAKMYKNDFNKAKKDQ